ncbi:MAG: dodecin family protein [Petrimonas sp.]|nr:dodecin family protein [Petrimonas sp.]
MSVLKVIEVLASSPESWEDAAKNAVEKASKTVKGIRSIYIQEQTAVVNDGKITQYRINAKITFDVLD